MQIDTAAAIDLSKEKKQTVRNGKIITAIL